MSLGAKWRDRTVDRRVTDFMTFDLGGGSFHDFNFFFSSSSSLLLSHPFAFYGLFELYLSSFLFSPSIPTLSPFLSR